MITNFNLPKDNLHYYLVIAYLCLVRPIIEEFFWRTYMFELYYEREFEFLFVSLLSTGQYGLIGLLWYDWKVALIIVGACWVFARIQVEIKWHLYEIGTWVTHIAASLALYTCWFLSK